MCLYSQFTKFALTIFLLKNFTNSNTMVHFTFLKKKTKSVLMQDVEREFKASVKDRKHVNERMEVIENDVNHIMGRGETSDVSGVPTLNRLLKDIDELNANKTKTETNFDEFKNSITEKLSEETKQVRTSAQLTLIRL